MPRSTGRERSTATNSTTKTDMESGKMTPDEFRSGTAPSFQKLRDKIAARDQSLVVAKMVLKRLGIQEHPREGSSSGGPLVSLCLDHSNLLKGAVLVQRVIPPASAALEAILAPTNDESLEDIYSKTGRSRAPRKVLEDTLAEAEDFAGAWISQHRLRDVAIVFKSGVAGGGYLVYSRDTPGRFRGIKKPSMTSMALVWAWREDEGESLRVLSSLDSFLIGR